MTPARPAPPSKEIDTVKAIVDYLQMRGCLAWRMNTGAFKAEHAGKTRFHRFGVKGMSDVIGIVPLTRYTNSVGVTVALPIEAVGRFLAIEVKSATGKPSPEQVAFLAAVVKAGGIAFLARSLDDVRERGL
jgi:hypothetical protein